MHPLPESLVDYVFDFGALHPDTEKLYIRAMLKSCLAAVPAAAAAAGAAGAAAGLCFIFTFIHWPPIRTKQCLTRALLRSNFDEIFVSCMCSYCVSGLSDRISSRLCMCPFRRHTEAEAARARGVANAANAAAAAVAAANPQQAANAEFLAFKSDVQRCVQALITSNQVCV